MPYLHLAVRYEDPQAPKAKAIQEVLDKAKSWYRYAPNCWIIYTKLEASEWARRLRGIPGMEDHTAFFICELDTSNNSGWQTEDFWKWLNKERS